MNEERKTADVDAGGEDDGRRQLWVRAGVAVGLIALLLGGLAVFDYQSRPPEPDEEVALPTKPIAPAQVAPETGRDAPPDVIRAGSEAVPRPIAAAEDVPPPALPPDARAGRAERLERPANVVEGTRPLAHPAQSGAVPALPGRADIARKPEEPKVPAVPAAPAAPAQPVAPAARNVTAAAAPAPASPAAPLAAPAARPAPAVSAPVPAATPAAASAVAPARQASGEGAYYLPLGAFPTVDQAEVLRARLSAEGVPSHLETRVLVGPFADRRDALAAQARLREKGFTPGELLPFRR